MSRWKDFFKKNMAPLLTLGGIAVVVLVVVLISNRATVEPEVNDPIDLNESVDYGSVTDLEPTSPPSDENDGYVGENIAGDSNELDQNTNLVGEDEPLNMGEVASQTEVHDVPPVQVADAGNVEGTTVVEDEKTTEASGVASIAGDTAGTDLITGADNEKETTMTADAGTTEGTTETVDAVETSGTGTTAEISIETSIAALSFSENQGLCWPVQGEVILNYSRDHLIYHPTLDQFRTNPAIVIACPPGSEILAAADGVVTEVANYAKTGTTITTAIGDDYYVVYGQLAENELKVGDHVTEGQVIGCTTNTSKFYTMEGDNLYFQVIAGDTTVNPMSLLREDIEP